MKMKTEDALVSVIMPAYNAEKYIKETIESVLQQTHTNIELIIINDCSGDLTPNIVKEIAKRDKRIVFFNNETNLGCADSRNKALTICKGEYIAFIDSDDVWEKEKIKKQLNHIQVHKADMVFTAYKMIDSDGEFIKTRNIKTNITIDDLLRENSVIFSSTLFSKKSVKGISFDAIWYHEDYIFLLECLKRNQKFIGIDEVLVKYRVHNQGRSFNKVNAAKYRWKIYRKFLNLSIWESFYYFFQYAVNGLKKYQ